MEGVTRRQLVVLSYQEEPEEAAPVVMETALHSAVQQEHQTLAQVAVEEAGVLLQMCMERQAALAWSLSGTRYASRVPLGRTGEFQIHRARRAARGATARAGLLRASAAGWARLRGLARR